MRKVFIDLLVLAVVCFVIVCGFAAVISITTAKCRENQGISYENTRGRNYIARSHNATKTGIKKLGQIFRHAKIRIEVKRFIQKAYSSSYAKNYYHGEAFFNPNYIIRNPKLFWKVLMVNKARKNGTH